MQAFIGDTDHIAICRGEDDTVREGEQCVGWLIAQKNDLIPNMMGSAGTGLCPLPTGRRQ